MGVDPNKVPLNDKSVVSKYASETGKSYKGNFVRDFAGGEIYETIQNGGNVIINTSNGNGLAGHAMVIKSATIKRIIKPSGKIVLRYTYEAMNPANGGRFVSLSHSSVRRALNIFYIF